MSRRRSARLEELDGDDDGLDCFQRKEMRTAGGGAGGRSFGIPTPCWVSCERKCTEGMRRCA
jgi:hypothetical protein